MVGKPYLCVHKLSSFGHARSWAQPLAWSVTLSAAGGKDDGDNFEKSNRGGWGGGWGLLILKSRPKWICDIVNCTYL